MDGAGQLGEGGLRPVVAEIPVVAVTQVVGRGVDQECLRQVQPRAKAAGVHRGLRDGPGGRRAVFVAAQEFGGTGQVLCHLPVDACPGEGVGQQLIAVLGQYGCGPQRLRVEAVGDGEGASGQELADPAVLIRPAGCGQGGVLALVLGPHGPQDQDGCPAGVGQQGVHGGRDALAGQGVAEVVLCLVQPHDGARADALEVLQCGVGAGRIEGVPQPPPFVREGLDRFPARSGLSGRGGSDQHDHAAVPLHRASYRPGEYVVVAPAYVAGQRRRAGVRAVTCRCESGRVDLEVVGVPIGDRLARYRLGTGRGLTLGVVCRAACGAG